MKKSKRTSRDDFQSGVPEALAKQVGYVCSRPECRASTIGPASNGKSSSSGVAAHICAAAEGGPRYNPEQTPNERSSQANGLWVCHSCSRLIDNDPAAYPEDMLLRWKAQAIEAAAKQHGTRVLTERDVQEQMASTLSALPTPMSLLALPNAHAAVEVLLEQLDNRLQFKVSHGPQGSRYQIRAKETVPLKMSVVVEDVEKTQEDWSAYIENGRKMVFKAQSVSITGSKAMERVANPSGPGLLELSPKAMKLKLRLVTTKAPKRQLAMGDALLTHGIKRYEMTSELFGGLMPIRLQGPLALPASEAPSLNMELRYAKWQGVDLRLLDEFDAVHRFFEELLQTKEVALELYDDGKRFLERVNVHEQQETVAYHLKWLRYVDMGRRLCQHYDLSIPFDSMHVVSHDEYKALSGALTIVEGELGPKRAKAKPVQLTVDLTHELEVPSEGVYISMDAQLHNDETESCRLFGHEIDMPPLHAIVEGQAFVESPGTYRPHDVAIFTLPMKKGSKIHMFYEEPSGKLNVRKLL